MLDSTLKNNTINDGYILIMFDKKQKTSDEKKEYRQLIKLLRNEGFSRIQYSIFSKYVRNSSNNGAILDNFAHIKAKLFAIYISKSKYENSYLSKEMILNTKDSQSLIYY